MEDAAAKVSPALRWHNNSALMVTEAVVHKRLKESMRPIGIKVQRHNYNMWHSM